jgi:hypothetical protein
MYKTFSDFGADESFKGCGIQRIENKREPSGSVHGEKNTRVGKHPWHAALTVRDEGTIFCGGSLVSKTVIVTGEMKIK